MKNILLDKTVFCAVICVCLCFGTWQVARADETAEALLKSTAARAKSIETLTARIELSWHTPAQGLKRNVGQIKLMKPNLALIELTGDYPLVTLASDGRSRYMFAEAAKYSLAAADPGGKNIDSPWWAFPVRFFFTQSIKPFGPDSPDWKAIRYAGVETVAAETYDVLEIAGDQPMPYTAKFYFDRGKLLRRSEVKFGEGAGAAVFTAQIEQVNTQRRFSRNTFRFTPPLTAKLDTGFEEKMLALGEVGPDFSLRTPDDKLIRLETIRHGKKAILINFWFVACPPCRLEFELFQKLYSKLKDEGFLIIAINNVDTAAEIRSYVAETRLTFPIVMAERDVPGVLASYKIQTHPSTYLLNSEGKIVYRAIGVDEAGLLRALKELGLQP